VIQPPTQSGPPIADIPIVNRRPAGSAPSAASPGPQPLGNQAQIFLAFGGQQAGEPTIDSNRAPAAARLGFLEPPAVHLHLFETAGDRQRLGAGIKIRPAKSQNFVSSGAGEGRDGDDRIERGAAEAGHKRRKLVLIENPARLAIAGNRRLGFGSRANDEQPLAHGRIEASPEHGMNMVHRPRRPRKEEAVL